MIEPNEQRMDRRTSTRLGEHSSSSNLEAHLIADMLRIESITAELREFKEDTKAKLNKLEGWIVTIVGVTITTLLATLGSLLFRVVG